jgi:hypothetical protein
MILTASTLPGHTVLKTLCAIRVGDRICPGSLFALRILFLNIASVLAVFDIEAPVGEKLEPKFHESHVRYVLRFGVPALCGRTRGLHVCFASEGIPSRSSV